MTGHPGERRNRAVALRTDDLRLYHRLVPVFETRGIPIVGLGPGEDVPASVMVLLDGPEDDPRSVPVREDDEATLLAAFQRLDDRPTASGPDGYREVVFGIDPGETIGLAVVADGMALMVAEAHDAESAVDRLARWRTGLQTSSWRLHVGDGAPEVGATIQAAATVTLPDMPCVFVPESRTTPKAAITGSRHTDAAVHIAMRRP